MHNNPILFAIGGGLKYLPERFRGRQVTVKSASRSFCQISGRSTGQHKAFLFSGERWFNKFGGDTPKETSDGTGQTMIDQWQSIMDNLSDIYYLVRLIIRQVSIYLRDLILYKFFWMAANTDEFEAAETKLRGLTFRNMLTDIVAFSVICVVLFILVLLSSKCEKEDGHLYTATGIETLVIPRPSSEGKIVFVTANSGRVPTRLVSDLAFPLNRVSVNLPEDPFRVSDTSSTTLDCFHACGDSVCPRRPRIPKRNYSDEDVVRVRSSSEKRKIPKKSIFGLTAAILPHNSQSTQTTDKLFGRNSQRWLIRRTRSGQVYGKYPI